MEKGRKEKPKKIITQYVSCKFNKEQIVNNIYMSGLGNGTGVNFNAHYTYSAKGFCSVSQAYNFIDRLDFHSFQEVLNFLNKKWGWKVLSIVPIIITEKHGYSGTTYGETYTDSFLYTFYREIEEDEEE